MQPDTINGLFETFGGLAVWLNVWKLYKDKHVKGVHFLTMLFFASWGYWNLYYYPHLNQWFSFYAGASLAIANSFWVGMTIYYTRKQWI